MDQCVGGGAGVAIVVPNDTVGPGRATPVLAGGGPGGGVGGGRGVVDRRGVVGGGPGGGRGVVLPPPPPAAGVVGLLDIVDSWSWCWNAAALAK